MYKKCLACITAIGVFFLSLSMQASTVYSAVTNTVSTQIPQQIYSAKWSVYSVDPETSTVLITSFLNIKRASDPGKGTYFSIRNFGDVTADKVRITVVNSNNVGNGNITIEWCPNFPWDEIAGTCNGSTTGTLLLTAPPKIPTTIDWARILDPNSSVRLRLQRGPGTTPTADTTITIEIPRSFLRPAIRSAN